MNVLKRYFITTLLAFVLLIWTGHVSKVEAFPFIEVEGFVSPDFSTLTDIGFGMSEFGRIDYWFDVVTAGSGAKMDRLSLEFNQAVFSSPGTVFNLSPNTWSGCPPCPLVSPSGNFYHFVTAGMTLSAGERLSFSVEDAVVYNQALTDTSLWQEGQVWSQSWSAGDTFGGGDGGSTATTPEPATLLLLGSGLAGLGLLGRRMFRSLI